MTTHVTAHLVLSDVLTLIHEKRELDTLQKSLIDIADEKAHAAIDARIELANELDRILTMRLGTLSAPLVKAGE